MPFQIGTRFRLSGGSLALALSIALTGTALARDIKVVHVYDKTGALEAYAKQTQAGLLLGLEYATKGTMMVGNDKIVIIERDNQGKPDVAKAQLAAAYSDDGADIAIGPTSSNNALAMLPVAEEYKKILLVEPAVADSITGAKWNRYIFRTGRNS
ncbi:MAG: h16 [Tardiphaga sp.]|nr:h16 [Tardiphaga sp.]